MLKTILVHLTGSPEDHIRLSYAQSLAAAFSAHLIGAHLHTLPEILDVAEPTRSAFVRQLLDESNATATADLARLKDQLAALPISTELRALHGMADDVAGQLARLVRETDLFIGTRPYGDPAGHYQVEEAVLFGSSRPCLFLPPGGTPKRQFDTVLLAWDGSREAARALNGALPFLKTAKNTIIAHITPPAGTAPAFDTLIAHLRRHGVTPTTARADFRSNEGEQLHEMAHQHGADLIVSGAYGHPRIIEWAFGGATRYLLRNATLPVLMTH